MAAKENFDADLLISEIQKRPAIYDPTLAEYNDRTLRDTLWEEVCETVEDNWTALSEKEKKKRGTLIKQRWKSLRSYFRIEFKFRKENTGKQARKRKKCLFYEKLHFLVPIMESKLTTTEKLKTRTQNHVPAQNPKPGEEEQNEGPKITEYGSVVLNDPPTKGTDDFDKPKRCRKLTKAEDYEQQLLDILRAKKDCDMDEDKTFLMSLVPDFKKLTGDQKYTAKIEILNVMQKVKLGQLEPSRAPSENHNFGFFPNQITMSLAPMPLNMNEYQRLQFWGQPCQQMNSPQATTAAENQYSQTFSYPTSAPTFPYSYASTPFANNTEAQQSPDSFVQQRPHLFTQQNLDLSSQQSFDLSVQPEKLLRNIPSGPSLSKVEILSGESSDT